jgi:hypothetical protein
MSKMKERWQSMWIALQFLLLCAAGTLGIESISHGQVLDTFIAFLGQLVMFFTISSAME